MKVILKALYEVSWLIAHEGRIIFLDADNHKVMRITKETLYLASSFPQVLCSHYISDIACYDEDSPYSKRVQQLIDNAQEKYRKLFNYTVLRDDARAVLFYWFIILKMKLKGIPYQKDTRRKAPMPCSKVVGGDEDKPEYEMSEVIDLRESNDQKIVEAFVDYLFSFHCGIETTEIYDDLDPYALITGQYKKSQKIVELIGKEGQSTDQPTAMDREIALFMFIENLSHSMGFELENNRILNSRLYEANSMLKFKKVLIGHLQQKGLLQVAKKCRKPHKVIKAK